MTGAGCAARYNLHMHRRRFLGAAMAASLVSPARAQGLGDIVDRARALDQMHAIVIGKNGEIVLAEALRGPALSRPHNIKSVSKSVVAALTGIAIDAGELPGLDATLGDLAPGLIPRDADPRVAALTIENLVTMQAGLERTSGGNYGGWVSSRNWVADALSRPFVAEPGSGMLYSTGSFHILGAILSEVTGQSLLSLARRGIGDPLGIEIPAWTRDPQGRYMGGNEMALTPEGLWRFGEAYRTGGTPILSNAWVRDSFTPRTRSRFSRHDYGLGWFLTQSDGTRIAYGRGYGGQMIYVVPEAGVTVAITSDPLRPARSQGYAGDLNALMARVILPALA